MIKIGVTENVFLSEQKKNDKGTLEVTITEAGGEKKKLSAIEQLNENSDTSGTSGGTTLMLFMPSTEYQNEPISAEKRLQNLTKFRNQMTHFLKGSVTESKIKWNVFKGIIIKNDDDLMDKLMDNDIYAKIYGNIVDQFVEQASTFKINDPAGKKFRFMGIRQSKEKSFVRLRDNYLDSRPFWESMDIPKDKSKMWVKAGSKDATKYFEPDADGYVPAFDPYEISKGFDNPIISSSKADGATNTPEEAAAVENVFGQQPAEAIDFSAPTFGIPDAPSEVPGLTDMGETKEGE